MNYYYYCYVQNFIHFSFHLNTFVLISLLMYFNLSRFGFNYCLSIFLAFYTHLYLIDTPIEQHSSLSCNKFSSFRPKKKKFHLRHAIFGISYSVGMILKCTPRTEVFLSHELHEHKFKYSVWVVFKWIKSS